MADFDFSGDWNTKFTWVNSTEPEGGVSEYDIKIHKTGNQVVMQSIPSPLGNYFVARLTLDEKFLTGSWQEQAQPDGLYKGQIYNGVGMLKLDDSGTLRGKIIEYNNDMEITVGDWEVTRKSS